MLALVGTLVRRSGITTRREACFALRVLDEDDWELVLLDSFRGE